jgi:hypothetical protein
MRRPFYFATTVLVFISLAISIAVAEIPKDRSAPTKSANVIRTLLAPDGTPTDYSTDDDIVYYNGAPLDDANRNTFSIVGLVKEEDGGIEYAKDDQHVFYFDKIISSADPTTFQLLGGVQSCGRNCFYNSRDAVHYYMDGVLVR